MFRTLRNEKGIALILVVWAMVLLIALGTEFAFSMRTEINTTRNFKEDAEAYYLAKAGVQLAMAEILRKARFHSWNPEKGYIIDFLQKEEEEETSLAGETPELEEVVREDIPLGNGTIAYTIRDENGKLNINQAQKETLVKALAANGMQAGAQRDEVADSILDWIDPDDNHRLNGAENDYYMSQFPPYMAKNGPLDSMDELLRVKGFTPELLYGSPDYDEAEDKEGLQPGLMRLFTVFNIPFFNPNTAEEEVLSIAYPADKVQEILSARNSKGYYAETLSSHFRVQATGKMNHSETRHTIVAVLEKVGTDETAQLLVRYWKDNEFGL